MWDVQQQFDKIAYVSVVKYEAERNSIKIRMRSLLQ